MKLSKITIIILGLLTGFLPFFVQAATGGPLVPCSGLNCSIACFFVMIEMIINFLLYYISIPLAVTGFMVAGIHLIFGSSEQAITRGKAIFKFTFVGLFLAFAAWLIIDLILGNLLAPGYKPWNQFPGGC